VFALRDDEKLTLVVERPLDGCWLAVQLHSVEMPSGPRANAIRCDGTPVEEGAVFACEWNHQRDGWQWCRLSPDTKEIIGHFLLAQRVTWNEWHFVVIE
jgi:hypothetical protein